MIVKSQKSCNFCVTILDESSQSRLYIKMNGHARTVYSTLSRVCNLFFSRLCAVLLVLPAAVSTPVDVSPYFFNVGSWLVNLPTMVSLSDWRVLLFH